MKGSLLENSSNLTSTLDKITELKFCKYYCRYLIDKPRESRRQAVEIYVIESSKRLKAVIKISISLSERSPSRVLILGCFLSSYLSFNVRIFSISSRNLEVAPGGILPDSWMLYLKMYTSLG